MRVKFVKAVSGRGFLFGKGVVKDLPDSEAEYWIKEGYAQVYKEPVQKPLVTQEVKKTRQPAKTTKRPVRK